MKTQYIFCMRTYARSQDGLNRWLIILNPTKTKSMTFTRKKETNWPEAKFNNITIQDEKIHTHLGITFSSDATWDEHLQSIYKKAAYRLNIMRMLKTKTQYTYDIGLNRNTNYLIRNVQKLQFPIY